MRILAVVLRATYMYWVYGIGWNIYIYTLRGTLCLYYSLAVLGLESPKPNVQINREILRECDRERETAHVDGFARWREFITDSFEMNRF